MPGYLALLDLDKKNWRAFDVLQSAAKLLSARSDSAQLPITRASVLANLPRGEIQPVTPPSGRLPTDSVSLVSWILTQAASFDEARHTMSFNKAHQAVNSVQG